jgi:hypothetical protein
MTQHCTPEEKQHMIDLIEEMKGMLVALREGQIPRSERRKEADRLSQMRKEMLKFRREYPDD